MKYFGLFSAILMMIFTLSSCIGIDGKSGENKTITEEQETTSKNEVMYYDEKVNCDNFYSDTYFEHSSQFYSQL